MKKIVLNAIRFLPTVLLTVLFANVFYLSAISLIPTLPVTPALSVALYGAIFCGLLFFTLKRYPPQPVTKIHYLAFVVLILGMIAVLLRFVFIYPAFDDRNVHLILSPFLWNFWNNPHFLPSHHLTYTPSYAQMVYAPLAAIVGLRATLLVVYTIYTFWFVSLYVRFAESVKGEKAKTLLFLVFVSILFMPASIQSFVLYMPDFAGLLLVLESVLLFRSKDGSKTLALLIALLAFLVKVSTVLFVAPVLVYFVIRNWGSIEKWIIILFIGITSVFYLRMYLEIGTPVFGLFNWVFQSSIYETRADLVKDTRWGPTSPLQTLVWPFIAPLTSRFDELSTLSPYPVPYVVRLLFTILLAVPFVVGIVLALIKKRLIYLLLLVSYLFWAFVTGYSRYVVPVYALSALILYLGLLESRRVQSVLKSVPAAVYMVVAVLVVVGSLYTLRLDLGFRPLPNTLNELTDGSYGKMYQESLALVGKDTPQQIASDLAKDFEGKDVIVPHQTTQALAFFYAFFASYKEKTIVYPLANTKGPLHQRVLDDPKISAHLKTNMRKLEQCNKVVVVSEEINSPDPLSMSLPENFTVSQFCTCQPKKMANTSSYLTGSQFFGGHFLIYTCQEK